MKKIPRTAKIGQGSVITWFEILLRLSGCENFQDLRETDPGIDCINNSAHIEADFLIVITFRSVYPQRRDDWTHFVNLHN